MAQVDLLSNSETGAHRLQTSKGEKLHLDNHLPDNGAFQS
jgi:hypothetical protein